MLIHAKNKFILFIFRLALYFAANKRTKQDYCCD